jgi:hypothetical protein
MAQRTLFVPGSQYVLFALVVLACFNRQWPKLNLGVACFDLGVA